MDNLKFTRNLNLNDMSKVKEFCIDSSKYNRRCRSSQR